MVVVTPSDQPEKLQDEKRKAGWACISEGAVRETALPMLQFSHPLALLREKAFRASRFTGRKLSRL